MFGQPLPVAPLVTYHGRVEPARDGQVFQVVWSGDRVRTLRSASGVILRNVPEAHTRRLTVPPVPRTCAVELRWLVGHPRSTDAAPRCVEWLAEHDLAVRDEAGRWSVTPLGHQVAHAIRL